MPLVDHASLRVAASVVEKHGGTLSDDDPGGLVGIARDTTTPEQAEAETRKTAQLLDTALQNLTDGFYTLDRQWRFTYVNAEAERLLRRSRDDLLGKGVWDLFPRLSVSAAGASLRRSMTEGEPVQLTYRESTERWIEVRAHPSTIGLGITLRDVTTERLARQQLRLLEASVSQLNDIVLITEAQPSSDPGPRIVFVNDSFERITGYARAEVLGRSPRMLQGPLTNRSELDRIRVALANFQPVHTELLNYAKNGSTYWLEIDIVPFGVEGRPASHFVAVQRDITQRKRDEDALRELNSTLEARVGERTADLIKAREVAEEASRAKSDFLATMSHEIRTPMNGVIGMVDVLQQTSLQTHQVEMVDLIRDAALSLLEIIDDILDFSKVEAGKLVIEFAPMAVADVIEKACAMLEPVAIKARVEMKVSIDSAIPRALLGDATRLRQVIVNLLSNAIKFSGGREKVGHVSLLAAVVANESSGVTLEVVVEDNGIGMDAQTQARLFAPFSQADASTTRRFGGTGLGLAISRKLVDLMGGEISVLSTLGQGSTFTVRWQLPEVETPFAVTAGRVEKAGGAATSVPIAAPGPVPARHGARRTGRLILVAEDNETNRKVIKAQLALLGFSAKIVNDGREALEEWRRGDYALLLTDLHMPALDGHALASAIRAEEPEGHHIPILALTANALRDEEVRCRASGMDGYMTKPIQLSLLETAIERWLGSVAASKPTPESVHAPAVGPPADLRVLVALIGDDEDGIEDMLNSFRLTATETLEAFRQGIAEGVDERVASAAHKLKSAARSIGAVRLGDVCAEIEAASKAGMADEAQVLLPLGEAELHTVLGFLDSRSNRPV